MTNTVNNERLSIKDLLFAFIVSLVLMFLAGSGYAQGISTAKAGDATEVVNTTKEVKPILPVPASLAKAMVAAKTRVGETAKSSNNRQTMYVWYPAPGNQTGCTVTTTINQTLYPVADYPDVTDLPVSENPSETCNPGSFCCAKGYLPTTSNFTTTTIDGVDYWVPVSTTAQATRTKS